MATKLSERVMELDRLYLLHDSLWRLWEKAIGTPDEGRLRRAARKAWKRYAELRDSRRGLPPGLYADPAPRRPSGLPIVG